MPRTSRRFVAATAVLTCAFAAAAWYIDQLPDQALEVDGLSVVVEIETPFGEPRGSKYMTLKYRGAAVGGRFWVGGDNDPPADLKIIVDEAVDLACIYNPSRPGDLYYVIVHLPSRTYWTPHMEVGRAPPETWRPRYSLLAARHPQVPACERLGR